MRKENKVAEVIANAFAAFMLWPKQAARAAKIQEIVSDITKCTGKTETEIFHEYKTTRKSLNDIRNNAFETGEL